MEDAKDIVTDFYAVVDRMIKVSDNYLRELSDADLAQEDILHYLEFGNPNAVEMVKLTKKLIEVRKRRRKIKDCSTMVYRLISKDNLQSLKDRREALMNPKAKSYLCRTYAVKEAIGEQKELTSV